jgi:hypothetical protein
MPTPNKEETILEKLTGRLEKLIGRLLKFFNPLLLPFLNSFVSPISGAMFEILRDVKQSQNDFDRQVSEAVEGLRKTSALIVNLQQNVEDRMARLQALRQEHEQYSALAQIEATKADALLKQIAVTLGREQRSERWIALVMHLGVGLLFFFLGVVASDSLKGWMQHLWSIYFH